MYFHTDSVSTKDLISALAERALDTGDSLRISVDEAGRLKMKVGEGMWTAPMFSTPDPYRDNG